MKFLNKKKIKVILKIQAILILCPHYNLMADSKQDAEIAGAVIGAIVIALVPIIIKMKKSAGKNISIVDAQYDEFITTVGNRPEVTETIEAAIKSIGKEKMKDLISSLSKDPIDPNEVAKKIIDAAQGAQVDINPMDLAKALGQGLRSSGDERIISGEVEREITSKITDNLGTKLVDTITQVRKQGMLDKENNKYDKGQVERLQKAYEDYVESEPFTKSFESSLEEFGKQLGANDTMISQVKTSRYLDEIANHLKADKSAIEKVFEKIKKEYSEKQAKQQENLKRAQQEQPGSREEEMTELGHSVSTQQDSNVLNVSLGDNLYTFSLNDGNVIKRSSEGDIGKITGTGGRDIIQSHLDNLNLNNPERSIEGEAARPEFKPVTDAL